MGIPYYGLQHRATGKLLRYKNYSLTLEAGATFVWVTDDYDHAAKVMATKIGWYDACYERPLHAFAYEELQISKVVYPKGAVPYFVSKCIR